MLLKKQILVTYLFVIFVSCVNCYSKFYILHLKFTQKRAQIIAVDNYKTYHKRFANKNDFANLVFYKFIFINFKCFK